VLVAQETEARPALADHRQLTMDEEPSVARMLDEFESTPDAKILSSLLLKTKRRSSPSAWARECCAIACPGGTARRWSWLMYRPRSKRRLDLSGLRLHLSTASGVVDIRRILETVWTS